VSVPYPRWGGDPPNGPRASAAPPRSSPHPVERYRNHEPAIVPASQNLTVKVPGCAWRLVIELD
jgi:hypothetical protein